MQSDYQKDSAEFAKHVSDLISAQSKQAREILEKALPNAAKIMSDLLYSEPMAEEQYRAAQMQFKSSAHILKIGGLEVNKTDHTVHFEPLQISRCQNEVSND